MACRQLGHLRAAAYTRGSFFDYRTGSAAHRDSEMQYVKCRGDETRLQDCSYTITRYSCWGNHDVAGVVCTSKYIGQKKYTCPTGGTDIFARVDATLPTNKSMDSLVRLYDGPSNSTEGNLATTNANGQLGYVCLPLPTGNGSMLTKYVRQTLSSFS